MPFPPEPGGSEAGSTELGPLASVETILTPTTGALTCAGGTATSISFLIGPTAPSPPEAGGSELGPGGTELGPLPPNNPTLTPTSPGSLLFTGGTPTVYETGPLVPMGVGALAVAGGTGTAVSLGGNITLTPSASAALTITGGIGTSISLVTGSITLTPAAAAHLVVAGGTGTDASTDFWHTHTTYGTSYPITISLANGMGLDLRTWGGDVSAGAGLYTLANLAALGAVNMDIAVGAAGGYRTMRVLTATPAIPAPNGPINKYRKGTKLIFQYNDAGTMRYKYLDLAASGVTWVYSPTAP